MDKSKRHFTGVPATEINPLVFELAGCVVSVGNGFELGRIHFMVFKD